MEKTTPIASDRASRAALLLALAWLLLLPGSARADGSEEREEESNHIELVVDGVLTRTWTVSELMDGRFDWESPKKQFYPAVPLSFVLFSERGGVDPGRVKKLKLVGTKSELEIEGSNLSLMDDLLLKLDIARSGTWALVGRDRESKRRLDELLGATRFKKVTRIEVDLERRATKPTPANSR